MGYSTTQKIREFEKSSTAIPSGLASAAEPNPPGWRTQPSHHPLADKRSRVKSSFPTKIIALTAQTSTDDRTLALAAGCDDFVSKPIQIDVILTTMADHLGLSYLYQAIDQTAKFPPSSSVILEPSSLQLMPPAWIAALHQTALNCDEEETALLIQQIPTEHTVLIESLNQLLQNYKFEVILQLTRSV